MEEPKKSWRERRREKMEGRIEDFKKKQEASIEKHKAAIETLESKVDKKPLSLKACWIFGAVAGTLVGIFVSIVGNSTAGVIVGILVCLAVAGGSSGFRVKKE